MDIDDKTYKEIEHLLALFYDGSIEGDDQDRLYDYFLNHKEVPKEWEVDAIIIRQLAIRRHCYKQREKLLQMMQSTPPRRSRLPLPAVVYRVAAVLLLLVGVGVALYSAWEQAPLQSTATMAQQSRPPAVQHSEPVADTATMPTPKPAPTMQPAADRDCQAMYAAHKEPTAPTPVPDIIATAPIEQEHIPVLLAETETQIEIEQNLVAIDTAIDNINALHTDTILQLQKDLPKYEINYLAYIDIQSYNAGNRIYFCNTDCTNEYMKETVCEMINGI